LRAISAENSPILGKRRHSGGLYSRLPADGGPQDRTRLRESQERRMKSGSLRTRLAALLLGAALLPAYASESGVPFKDVDADKNAYLSLDEFKDKGMDDLAFRAADLNGDGQVDPDEYDRYLARKAGDQPSSESGPGGQAKPAQPAPGY
jgi:hypothetical protein